MVTRRWMISRTPFCQCGPLGFEENTMNLWVRAGVSFPERVDLVDDFSQAAAWHVTLYEHGNFRRARRCVCPDCTGRVGNHWRWMSREALLTSRGMLRSGSGGGSQRWYFAVGSTKELVLVPDSKLAKSDPKQATSCTT